MSKIAPTVPLEQLCDSNRGITYGIVKVGDFTPGGVPVIRGGDIRDGRIVFDDHKRVTEEVSNKFRRTILRGGEILINLIAEPGHVAIVPENLVGSNVSRDVAVIPLNNSVEHRFVCYFLKSPDCVQWLASRLQGSVTQKINLNTLREVPVPLPPLPEQKAIAQILGSLDDKIELNRQMNQTLEAMAKAIFKSWFVDFDPVRAKMEGRQPAAMDAATAELFPAEFEESALGAIPKRWEAKPLSEVVNVNPRRILSKGEVAPYLDMASMPTQGHRPDNWINRAFGSGTKFVNGDTLLARITPCLENGKSAFVDFLESGQVGWGSTEYIILRPKPPLPVEYGYYLARSDDLRGYAIQNMTGSSGRQRVPANCFSKYFITVPSKEVAQEFGNFARPSMKKITANCEQSRTLASIRDTLLPKLLSGEIRIKEAEKIVGDVT